MSGLGALLFEPGEELVYGLSGRGRSDEVKRATVGERGAAGARDVEDRRRVLGQASHHVAVLSDVLEELRLDVLKGDAYIIAVFADYEVKAAPSDSRDLSGGTEDDVVAIIGFAGEQMRGSLVITARASSVEAWRVPFGDVDKRADVRDILGELTNMVLGRLKGKLLAEGLPILMSTPTTARGPAVMLARSGGPEEQLVFAGEGWSISTRVDAAFDDDFGLQEEPATVAAEAGDVMLF